MSIINAHAEVTSKVRGFKFGLSLHLHIIYSMYAYTPEPSLLTYAIVLKSRVLSYFFDPEVQRAWHMLILSPICYR